jgi:transcriptional regulator with XRE-family HTH domain
MKITEMVAKASWNKKIELLQVLNGLTQEEAAEKCGTTQKVFWLWTKGASYPRPNSRRAIAMAFGIPETEIFGESQTA